MKKAGFVVGFIAALVMAGSCYACEEKDPVCNCVSADTTKEICQPSTEDAFLYLDKKNYIYSGTDGKQYDFHVEDQRLIISDVASKKIYKILVPQEMGGVGFAIKPIELQKGQFFVQVIADIGAHAKNCGYWLLGQQKGKWKTYISIPQLEEKGYDSKEWHRINSKVVDNELIIETGYEYMPKGAEFGYQMKYAVDGRYKANWKADAKSFELEQLPVHR